MLSDMPDRFLAAEFVREQPFRLLDEELPYAVAVEVSSLVQRSCGLRMTFYGDRITEGRAPRRGEIAVLRYPRDAPDALWSTFYIKRIFALPGETVAISGDRISIDGERLKLAGPASFRRCPSMLMRSPLMATVSPGKAMMRLM